MAWYPDDLCVVKQEIKPWKHRRRASELDINRQICCAKRQQVDAMLHAAKHDYYSMMVKDNSHNSKFRFKVTDVLLDGDRQSPLLWLAWAVDYKFKWFLPTRIETILSSLGKTAGQEPLSRDAMPVDCSLSHFRPVTENEIRKLVMPFPSKSCELDPWLLSMCAAPMVPVLTQLVSASLSKGYADGCLKGDYVQPLLKRSDKHLQEVHFCQKLALCIKVTGEGGCCQAARTHGQICPPWAIWVGIQA